MDRLGRPGWMDDDNTIQICWTAELVQQDNKLL